MVLTVARRAKPIARSPGQQTVNDPIDLGGFMPTVRHYANNNHVVRVTCTDCKGRMGLDLKTLARGRHADTALDDLPIKCTVCSSRQFTVEIEYIDPRQKPKPRHIPQRRLAPKRKPKPEPKLEFKPKRGRPKKK
jgi:hypothetical protein